MWGRAGAFRGTSELAAPAPAPAPAGDGTRNGDGERPPALAVWGRLEGKDTPSSSSCAGLHTVKFTRRETWLRDRTRRLKVTAPGTAVMGVGRRRMKQGWAFQSWARFCRSRGVS